VLQTNDKVRVDLNRGEANILIDDAELEQRFQVLAQKGGFPIPEPQTPWQEIQRGMVAQFDEGMVLEPAIKYQRVAQEHTPRDNH